MPRQQVGLFFAWFTACVQRRNAYCWRMKFVTACLLILATLAPAQADDAAPDQAEYQFWENAKLGGRALACKDAAGKASIRAASRGLAHRLAGAQNADQLMQAFDEKVRLHHRFAQRASSSHRACDRNAKAIKDGLRRTRVIAADPD